jgi:hypothetical protein
VKTVIFTKKSLHRLDTFISMYLVLKAEWWTLTAVLLSGIRCLDRGSGMGKKSGSGMNNPDHISESLETFFWGVKILLMRIRDPGWKKFGSWINIPDSQH